MHHNNYATYPAIDSYEKTLKENLQILKNNHASILLEIEEKKKLLKNNLEVQATVNTKLTAANDIRNAFISHNLKLLEPFSFKKSPLTAFANGVLCNSPIKALTTKDLKCLSQEPIKPLTSSSIAPLSQDVLDSLSSLMANLSSQSYMDPDSLWPQDLGDPSPGWNGVPDSYYFGSFAKK